jgi:hypothetical protein
MSYRSHRHTTSVAQQDGPSTESTWTDDGKKRQYYSYTWDMQCLQWPVNIAEGLMSSESRKTFCDDSQGYVRLSFEEGSPPDQLTLKSLPSLIGLPTSDSFVFKNPLNRLSCSEWSG